MIVRDKLLVGLVIPEVLFAERTQIASQELFFDALSVIVMLAKESGQGVFLFIICLAN